MLATAVILCGSAVIVLLVTVWFLARRVRALEEERTFVRLEMANRDEWLLGAIGDALHDRVIDGLLRARLAATRYDAADKKAGNIL